MKTLAVLTAFAFLQVSASVGQETSPPGTGNLRQLLQQGLFEEEATRDVDKAAAAYAAIIAEYETQRNFAATALFRLAEIRAKQGNKAEAIALHQRLLAEFPKSEELGKLSKERLAALGGSLPAATAEGEAPTDAERKELAQLREMVKNSPDLINAVEDGQTPLLQATRKGWLVAAAFLLDHGADVNQLTPIRYDRGGAVGLGEFPLKTAAGLGHKAMVELLLARGADVKQKDQVGVTALYEACKQERIEVTRTLLAHGADPNIVAYRPDGDTGTPLHEAVKADNLPLVRLLLDHKANPSLLNEKGNSPLFTAVVNRKIEAIAKELLARGSNVNATTSESGTVLHLAAMPYGWPEIVPLLLEYGASVNALAHGPGRDQQTPLHFSLYTLTSASAQSLAGRESKQSEMLPEDKLAQLYKVWEALLAKGADINARDALGWTPLHLAAMRWNLPVDALMWLIKRGANIGAKDKDGRTPLDLIDGVSRRVEIERQLYFQQWSKGDAVKLLIYGYAQPDFAKQSLSFDRTAESSEPPSIWTMLVSAFESLESSWVKSGRVDMIVYRAQEGGEFQEHARVPFVLSLKPIGTASLPLPALQWGDIVVMKFVVPDEGQQMNIPKEFVLDGVRPRKTIKPTGEAKRN